MNNSAGEPKQVTRVELVSFATVSRLSRKLAMQIQESGFRPDVIVCIARGGFVPARLLCDFLNIYDLASIRIKHYTGSEKLDKVELLDPLNIDIKDKNILLVDDIDDTGDTLEVALGYLHDFKPGQIKTAVLHHKVISSLVPDYYAKKIIQWRWITYPWAIIEDVLGFVSRLQPVPDDIEGAIKSIKQSYGLKITRQVMEDVFRLLGDR